MYGITRRNLLLGAAGSVGAFAVAGAFAGSAQAQVTSLRIGASSVGSVFYTLAVGAGEIIRKYTGINTTVEPLGGSAANINSLGQSNVDLTIVNAFASYAGFTGSFDFKKKIDLRLATQGSPSFRYLFVRNGAGIKSPADLNGRTIISERRSLPELKLIFGAMAEHFGLDLGSMNLVSTSTSPEALDAIRSGAVDAMMLPFSPNDPMIGEPMQDDVMSFLPISKADADAICAKIPGGFSVATIAAKSYKGMEVDVPVFSLNTYMLMRPGLDEEAAYKVVKAMLEHVEEFGSFHSAGKGWTAERSVENPALPYHPGAVRYYKEAGLWTDALQARQDSLLKG